MVTGRAIQRTLRLPIVYVGFIARRGKGSHGTLYYGQRFTVVPDRKKELPLGTLRAMLEQLSLKQSDLN
ncbi:MAG: type II toxin-antitoxin system HicA family toxin [Acidobacteria bacterium]|nr:type II toxin-antitoxin system HicA family toxin [Acidobacteriota bacterium]